MYRRPVAPTDPEPIKDCLVNGHLVKPLGQHASNDGCNGCGQLFPLHERPAPDTRVIDLATLADLLTEQPGRLPDYVIADLLSRAQEYATSMPA